MPSWADEEEDDASWQTPKRTARQRTARPSSPLKTVNRFDAVRPPSQPESCQN